MKLKEQKDIDKLFKSKLVDKEFALTPERLIEINRQLDTLPHPKKRKVFIYFISIGALLFMLSIGICFLSRENQDLSSTQRIWTKQEKNIKKDENMEITIFSELEKNEEAIISIDESKVQVRDHSKFFIIDVTKQDSFVPYSLQHLETRSSIYLETDEMELASIANSDSCSPENELKQVNTENDQIDSTMNIIDEVEFQIKEPRNKNNIRFWTFQTSTGISIVSKKILGGSSIYQSKRSQEEKNILTSQFDVGFNYNLNKLRLSTGINFIQYGEKINYSGILKDSTYISSYTVITDTAGNTTTVPNYTTVSYTDSTLTNSNGSNRHTYLTIPLSIGYQFNTTKSNFSISPKVGIGLRFLIDGDGKYSSNDLNQVQMLKDKPISMSYHGAVEFSYKLNNLTFFVTPNYNGAMHSFNSIHRYNAIGTMIGVIYHP